MIYFQLGFRRKWLSLAATKLFSWIWNVWNGLILMKKTTKCDNDDKYKSGIGSRKRSGSVNWIANIYSYTSLNVECDSCLKQDSYKLLFATDWKCSDWCVCGGWYTVYYGLHTEEIVFCVYFANVFFRSFVLISEMRLLRDRTDIFTCSMLINDVGFWWLIVLRRVSKSSRIFIWNVDYIFVFQRIEIDVHESELISCMGTF